MRNILRHHYAALGFLLALGLLLGMGILSCVSILRLAEAEAWHAQTLQIVGSLKELLMQVALAEDGQHDYVIDGDPKGLGALRKYKRREDEAIAGLRALTSGNPDQRARIDQLDRLLDGRVALLWSVVRVRRDAGFEAASRKIRESEGEASLQAIWDLAARIEAEERSLLQRREHALTAGTQRAIWVGAAGSACALAILFVVYGLLMRENRRRRETEKSLRESQMRHSRLFESSIIGVVIADMDGRTLEANDAFLQMVGYIREDLPLSWSSMTPPEWQHLTAPTVEELRTCGVASPREKEYFRKDGTRVPVLIGLRLLQESPTLSVGFVVDLTSVKRAEESARDAQAFLDSVVENLPSMVFVKSADDLKFVRLNRAGEDLLGFSRQDLLGKGDHDFFPPEEADFFTAKDRQVLTGQALVDIPEEPIVTKDKGVRYLHTKKVPILDKSGNPRYLLGISEDITEHKHARAEIEKLNHALERRAEQLEEANKELESFSYSVSHDLRAPLRHIDGFTDLLRRHADATLDETGRHYLDTIGTAARRMGMLIDDLLVFSRMGRKEMSRARVDLVPVVSEVIEDLKSDVKDRDVEWNVGPLPSVEGDPAMLRQVFGNLLDNAVKYTGKQPHARIEVAARDAGAEVVIAVRDNGVGFDMQYAHKLFSVFERLHRAEDFEGTGIGLANVRRIVQRHGGRTWAEGKVGEGATVYFSLPKQAEAA